MKLARSIAVFSLVLASLSVHPGVAAPRDFAVGVTLGSPMGLTVLQNIGETEAVQAAFEANIYNDWLLQADYLFKSKWPLAFEEQYGKAWIYYGPGMRFEWGGREQTVFGPYRTSEDGRFALRFPCGIQYYVPKLPFDLFFEMAPMVSLWESTALDMTSALGVRFNL